MWSKRNKHLGQQGWGCPTVPNFFATCKMFQSDARFVKFTSNGNLKDFVIIGLELEDSHLRLRSFLKKKVDVQLKSLTLNAQCSNICKDIWFERWPTENKWLFNITCSSFHKAFLCNWWSPNTADSVSWWSGRLLTDGWWSRNNTRLTLADSLR